MRARRRGRCQPSCQLPVVPVYHGALQCLAWSEQGYLAIYDCFAQQGSTKPLSVADSDAYAVCPAAARRCSRAHAPMVAATAMESPHGQKSGAWATYWWPPSAARSSAGPFTGGEAHSAPPSSPWPAPRTRPRPVSSTPWATSPARARRPPPRWWYDLPVRAGLRRLTPPYCTAHAPQVVGENLVGVLLLAPDGSAGTRLRVSVQGGPKPLAHLGLAARVRACGCSLCPPHAHLGAPPPSATAPHGHAPLPP